MGVGMVNITTDDVIKGLGEVGLIPFYPVSLQSDNLEEQLFKDKSFTDITQGNW